MRFHVYTICYADKYREIGFFPTDEVQSDGGIEALESKLKRDVAWFSPLGTVSSLLDAQGDVLIRFAAVNELIAAWEKKGSPKTVGQGLAASPMS